MLTAGINAWPGTTVGVLIVSLELLRKRIQRPAFRVWKAGFLFFYPEPVDPGYCVFG